MHILSAGRDFADYLINIIAERGYSFTTNRRAEIICEEFSRGRAGNAEHSPTSPTIYLRDKSSLLETTDSDVCKAFVGMQSAGIHKTT